MVIQKALLHPVRPKLALARRLAALRSELFGERGESEMAKLAGIPVRTWHNYETGVTVPAEIILKIIVATSVEPGWLLNGADPRFRQGPPTPPLRPT